MLNTGEPNWGAGKETKLGDKARQTKARLDKAGRSRVIQDRGRGSGGGFGGAGCRTGTVGKYSVAYP